MTAAAQSQAWYRDEYERARWAAIEIGERMLYESQHPDDDPYAQWTPSRHLNGSAGFAMAFQALREATGDGRFEVAMHDQLRKAARLEDRPQLGLINGISGLRAAAALAASEEPRYARLVAQCDSFVDGALPQAPFAPQVFCDFDVLTGWSGIRLARCVDGPRERDRSIDLIAWTIADEGRWCLPHPLTETVENDLGLAHGLPGMLAALALTVDEFDPELHELVATAAWTLARRAIGTPAESWPNSIQAPPRERYRAAWCYGAAGVLSALYCCARRLHDVELESFALGALVRIAGQPSSEWLVDDAAICHGLAGNALIFGSIGASSGVPALQEAAVRLVTEIVDVLDANGGKCMAWHDDGPRYAAARELTGIAGVVLTLLTLTGDADGSWMRCHALDPYR